MRVRPLQDEGDVRELIIAHGRAWQAAYAGILPASVIERVADEDPDAAHVAAEFDRLAGYGDGRVFVAEDDAGTVRGYAVFRWGENETGDAVGQNEAELKELYVDPEYWGRGYGTALLEAGIDRLPPDLDGLALEVLEDNDVGIGFYEGRDFEADGRSAFHIDDEAYPTRIYRRPLGG